MTSSAQINLLISENLLFHSKLKNCELFHENCRIMQCFNCYKYEHIIKICQKNVIYMQHQIMMIRYVTSEKCQQNTNMSTAIKIIQYELQNEIKEKNM